MTKPTMSQFSLGDRVVFYVALICLGFVVGYLAAGG